ncbi:MAG: hypothetical protein NTU91_15080 [Chloroflexi bacterium]|nr:hypothetical protein [Chloroflexota bacterium]
MTERSGSERSAARGLAKHLATAPLHPVLFFLFPVVSLLAWNIQELYPEAAIRSLVAALAACLVLWALFALITRDVWRAATLTSLAGLLFFSYGHVYASLSGVRSLGLPLARHRFLLPVWVGLFLAVWAIMTHKRASGRSITPVLNLIGLAALLLPVLSLSTFYLRAHTCKGGQAGRIPMVVLRPQAGEPLPDIYYIILDGYARSDYMSEVIGLDNSEFIAFLESEGFYVAAESRSNHNWTSLSLASSLNLTLAQDLGANMIPGYYPTPFIDFIRHSLVSRSLKEIGYHTIGL